MAQAPTPLFPKPNGQPPKPPRRHPALGGLTLAEYKALPHAEQMRLDNQTARGLVHETRYDPKSEKNYTVGRRKPATLI